MSEALLVFRKSCRNVQERFLHSVVVGDTHSEGPSHGISVLFLKNGTNNVPILSFSELGYGRHYRNSEE